MDRYTARSIVMKSPHISRGARMLYMALDEHQRDNDQCWPHQRTLCEYVGCSPRSLQYYLAELVREGLASVERVCAGGRNRYRLFHSTVAQSIALPDATHCATLTQPVARHKANRELKPNTPLTPQRGDDTCEWCHGKGTLRVTMINEPGQPRRRSVCEECRGTGRRRMSA